MPGMMSISLRLCQTLISTIRADTVLGVSAYRRARVGAAAGLVTALAVGWIATARVGHRNEPAVPVSAATSPVRCHEPTWRFPSVHCSFDGVEIDYRLIVAVPVGPVYLDAIGSTRRRSESGRPDCAHGAEDERSWSWPSQPRRVAGRFACRREHGRAAMWWTVADRGVLAHAVGADADLASLFAWWLSHSER
jgi:hypothetical protein